MRKFGLVFRNAFAASRGRGPPLCRVTPLLCLRQTNHQPERRPGRGLWPVDDDSGRRTPKNRDHRQRGVWRARGRRKHHGGRARARRCARRQCRRAPRLRRQAGLRPARAQDGAPRDRAPDRIPGRRAARRGRAGTRTAGRGWRRWRVGGGYTRQAARRAEQLGVRRRLRRRGDHARRGGSRPESHPASAGLPCCRDVPACRAIERGTCPPWESQGPPPPLPPMRTLHRPRLP